MLITSSNLCFTIRNSHGLWPPCIFLLYLKTVLCISPIIYQFSDGALNKYLITLNIWSSRIIYLRLYKSKLLCFDPWHQWEISWGNVGRWFQCGPFQSDMRGRIEVSGNVSGKVPGASGRPWGHALCNSSIETVKIRNYHKTHFLV